MSKVQKNVFPLLTEPKIEIWTRQGAKIVFSVAFVLSDFFLPHVVRASGSFPVHKIFMPGYEKCGFGCFYVPSTWKPSEVLFYSWWSPCEWLIIRPKTSNLSKFCKISSGSKKSFILVLFTHFKPNLLCDNVCCPTRAKKALEI